MAKKNSHSEVYVDDEYLRKQVLQFLQDHPEREYNYKQLSKQLDLATKPEQDALLEILNELNEKGRLDEAQRGRYRHKPTSQVIEGVVDMTKSGNAYIISEETDEDALVKQSNLGSALHRDKVKVFLYARRKNKKLEGEVQEVLERHKTEFVGTIQVKEKFGFVVPDNPRMPIDIFVPGRQLGGAKDGEKVVVAVTEWGGEKNKNPVGKVTTVLGPAGKHSTEMHAIIAEFDLPTKFPKEVMDEAEAIPEEIRPEDIKGRRDMRGITTFTIDPEDAKDFDDALSIQKLENGNWEIGIHIADVTHYVKPGTALDREGEERATSVYLVDRVIPMLPEKLSNKVCSLRPDEDKLTFSVIVEMNNEAEVVKEWFGKTIIRSVRRFAYEEAQERLETNDGDYHPEITVLNQLAHKLRRQKFKGGALSFETAEVKFKLDEEGRPIEVYPKVRKDAHKLIEDFMLLANRKVAEFIFKKNQKYQNRAFVYRHHDQPPSDKLDTFVRVAKRFGYEVNTANPSTISMSLSRLLEDVEGQPEQNLLQTLAIRSMSKAVYTTQKSSHYGLAFDYYTHFTSPIRRYPDVIAHRLLEHYLEGGKEVDQDAIEQQCRHSSEREIRAAEAERASIKYKQVQYMSERLGEEFAGIISGVTEWGIYVEMTDTGCEGMVRLSDLETDYFALDEENYRIVGQNTNIIYQLGDHVRVQVANTDLRQRTIDLHMIEGEKTQEQ